MFLMVNNVGFPHILLSLNIGNKKTKTGLLVKALDSQSNGPVFKATVWRPCGSKVESAFYPSEVDKIGTRNFSKLSDKKWTAYL